MSILNSIHSKILNYLEQISVLIDLEIYVVDNNLLRVAGTGMYSKMLGVVLHENSSNGWVLRNMQPLFVFNPTENIVCEQCPMKKTDNCGKEYSIHMPVMFDNECIGVVTISSRYDNESKTLIVRRKDELFKLINVIVEIIAKFVDYEIKIANYEKLMFSSEEAIIITDSKGEIIQTTKVIKERFHNFNNIYDLITKTELSYGDKFEKSTFKLNDNIHINRVKANLGNEYYNQIFFLKNKCDNKKEDEDILIDKNLFLAQIIGNSKNIEDLKKVIMHVAKYNSNCLILGESGTGKEMFARLIHNLSDRRDKPFVPINCAAIPDNLLESEMFGYESGAFTGANKKGKKGLFEIADTGTIFLDEIGDMPIYLQPKLLRVIETGKITRIGDTKEIQLDVRFIAATNNDLAEKIKNGEFRDDLYYRLCVIPIKIPALRDRAEDIIGLIKYFIDKYNNKFGKNIKEISPEAIRYLLVYDWPGNVRELENTIEYAVTMEKSNTLTLNSIHSDLKNIGIGYEQNQDISVSEFKRKNIMRLLGKYGDTVEAKVKISKELGISLSTLYRYLRKQKNELSK